ncbi:hypothetical protein [Bacillus paramycoides]|uniref:hypothetical protein n=1 Tax=Bacillus paramycoides TaxID=2026194 RepID=UPI003D1EA7F4
MSKKKGVLMECKEFKERTVLDNPPSEETKLRMVEFFMKTSIPRILEEERKVKEERG